MLSSFEILFKGEANLTPIMGGTNTRYITDCSLNCLLKELQIIFKII